MSSKDTEIEVWREMWFHLNASRFSAEFTRILNAVHAHETELVKERDEANTNPHP